MPQDLIGQVLLNQFRVDAFIASGGMGAVYRVWDLKRSVTLAMKVLHTDLADDASIVKRFKREAEALVHLAHPNIVPFYGLFQTEQLAFLLERFIDGFTLAEILRQRQKKPLPVEEALIYLKALCAALGYAHANGAVHCDVKPGNVMVDQGGIVYLTDFGIVRRVESTTTTLGTSGTPAYMAPEQIASERLTPATDLYSLGVMLFEMLTGQRPFRGDEPESMAYGSNTGTRILYGHMHLPPPNPSYLNSAIPPALAQVILRALLKRPEDRFQSMQEFFLAACQAAGIPASQVPDRVMVLPALNRPVMVAPPPVSLPQSPAGYKPPSAPLVGYPHSAAAGAPKRSIWPMVLGCGILGLVGLVGLLTIVIIILNRNLPSSVRQTETHHTATLPVVVAMVPTFTVTSPPTAEIPASSDSAVNDASVLYTAAAQTLSVELSQTAEAQALLATPTARPLMTPIPSPTTVPTPIPSPTLTMKPPTATKPPSSSVTPTRATYYPIVKCAASRLWVGDWVFVANIGGRNAIRETPDTHPSDNIITYAEPNDVLQIIGGPECNYGWVLWEVRTADETEGWTPEGDSKDFWLVPLESWEACRGSYRSRLQVGYQAFVSRDPPYSNRVRTEPDVGADQVGSIEPGEQVKILEGPMCSNNWVWWKVRSQSTNLTGWTSEGDASSYWLVPMAVK